VEDQKENLGPAENPYAEEAATCATQKCNFETQEAKVDLGLARAARAKLIEETTYQLTDLFTIVAARIDLMNERASATCQRDLLALRNVVTKGMELNQRLQLVARACRRAISS